MRPMYYDMAMNLVELAQWSHRPDWEAAHAFILDEVLEYVLGTYADDHIPGVGPGKRSKLTSKSGYVQGVRHRWEKIEKARLKTNIHPNSQTFSLASALLQRLGEVEDPTLSQMVIIERFMMASWYHLLTGTNSIFRYSFTKRVQVSGGTKATRLMESVGRIDALSHGYAVHLNQYFRLLGFAVRNTGTSSEMFTQLCIESRLNSLSDSPVTIGDQLFAYSNSLRKNQSDDHWARITANYPVGDYPADKGKVLGLLLSGDINNLSNIELQDGTLI